MMMRYKLYKAGKLWLTATITVLGLVMFSGIANADETTNQTSSNQPVVEQVSKQTTTTTNEQSTSEQQPVQQNGWHSQNDN